MVDLRAALSPPWAGRGQSEKRWSHAATVEAVDRSNSSIPRPSSLSSRRAKMAAGKWSRLRRRTLAWINRAAKRSLARAGEK
jgi:hypothetical protein